MRAVVDRACAGTRPQTYDRKPECYACSVGSGSGANARGRSGAASTEPEVGSPANVDGDKNPASNVPARTVAARRPVPTMRDITHLTLWEAQFGDFANGAQVIFDQFISSGERKWLRMSGLVCLLPHGYEGQGPEHSSARLERFLQMSAEDNMQVANCTTPANYFHILRRQLKRDIRKPLILMTPKSLLRHRRAVSRLEEMGPETFFHRLLWDDAQLQLDEKLKLVPDNKIRRVVLCSGKVYYDLYEEREKSGIDDVYLLRVEQLYPVPLRALVHELGRFKLAQFTWCQEEPRNMGAYHFLEPYLEWVLEQIGAANKRIGYAGRPASAATAVGQMSKHLGQLKALLEDALG